MPTDITLAALAAARASVLFDNGDGWRLFDLIERTHGHQIACAAWKQAHQELSEANRG